MVLTLRKWLVADITKTVKFFAILGFLFSTFGIVFREDLRVTFEFLLVGIALLSTIVLLAHQKREEATTAIWFSATALFFVSCDVTEVTNRIFLIMFGFFCLWLMRYIKPCSIGNTQ